MNKGISSNLMKFTAKRRRSKLEIKEAKQKEEVEKSAIVQKMEQIQALQ